jgi:hypothetical protein
LLKLIDRSQKTLSGLDFLERGISSCEIIDS